MSDADPFAGILRRIRSLYQAVASKCGDGPHPYVRVCAGPDPGIDCYLCGRSEWDPIHDQA